MNARPTCPVSVSRWTPGLRLTLLLGAVLVGSAQAADESKEPAAVLYFELDGRHVSVELDKPFALAALGGAKSATLRMEPWRQFSYGGVQLRYPREFTFEASLDSPGVAMWTLSGNDAKLMVHRYKGQPDAAQLQKRLVEETMKAFGAGAKGAPATLEVAGRTLKGTRINVQLAGTTLTQDVYAVRAGGDVVMLILQDSPGDAGQPTPEWTRMVKFLDESLKLPR